MSSFGKDKDRLEEVVRKTVESVVKTALSDVEGAMRSVKTMAQLNGQVVRLKENLETLKIEKDREDEKFARKEREIEHKVGLERKRQEFEISQAKREATVDIREENLSADRTRFEDQMKFQEERFTKEVKYLKDMMNKMMERLPSAEIYAEMKSG